MVEEGVVKKEVLPDDDYSGATEQRHVKITWSTCISPTIYTVTGGGSYCSGGTGVAIGLSNSETGVTYQLYVGGSTPVGSPVSGTGSAISFGSQTTAGTYTVIATRTSGGCTSNMTGNAIITVNALPTAGLTSSDADNIICAGDAVTFTATGGTSYEFFIGAESQGAASGTPTFNTSSLTNGQVVTVKVTDVNTCFAISEGITTTVNSLPTPGLTSSDADNIICAGDAVTFTATGGTSYEFFIGAESQGAASGTPTFNTSSLTNGQVVTVKVTDANSCFAISTGITTTVNGLPVASFTASPGAGTCAGTDVTYTTESLQSNYVWTVPGVLNTDFSITSGGTGLTDNTVTLKWLTEGIKTVTVNYTNAVGCSGITPASSTTMVNPLPAPSISGPLSAQPGSTGNTYFTQAGMSGYSWIVTGGAITAGESSPSITVTWGAEGTGTVSVNYTDGNGCTATLPAQINVTIESATADAYSWYTDENGTGFPPPTICIGGTFYLHAVEGQTTYRWEHPLGTVISTVQDPPGYCC